MWITLSTQKTMKNMEKLIKNFFNPQVIHIKNNSYPQFVDKNVDNFTLTYGYLFNIIRRGMRKYTYINMIYRFEKNQGGGYQ